MKTLRATGTIDFTALFAELTAALGAPGTPAMWSFNGATGQVSVLYDESIADATVQAVLTAHISQASIDARAAAVASMAARIATDEAERLSLKATSVLMNFINMSPSQIDAWCAANITDLASARNAIALLAKIVAVAIRRQVRNGT